MKMSKGEEKILSILKQQGLYLVREKTFDTLHKGKLRYDFYLPQYDMLIEYDGEQHFKQINHFQKHRTDFLKAQERDRIKNSYALAAGIILIRIPYWELDNINTFNDLFQEKFRVRTKFHNDYLKIPK